MEEYTHLKKSINSPILLRSLIIVTFSLITFNLSLLNKAQAAKTCFQLKYQEFNAYSFMNRLRSCEKEITSIEEALSIIPNEVFKNYSLVAKSRSLQESDPENPRVILYENNLSIRSAQPIFSPIPPIQWAITFNGKKEHRQGQNLEILAYNSKDQKNPIEFYDIEIGKSNGQPNVHISGPNPPVCMGCHQVISRIPRPLWDAKGFFPTVYGRFDFGGGEKDTEYPQFLKFINKAKDHPRYKFLKDVSSNISLNENGSIEKLLVSNSRLAENLTGLNHLRLSQLILETPNYNDYKYAIAASLLHCPNISNFVPEHLYNQHKSRNTLHYELRANPLDKEAIRKSAQTIHKFFNCQFCSSISSIELFENKVIDSMLSNIQPLILREQITPFILDLENKAAQWGRAADSIYLGFLRWILEGRGISMQDWAMDVGSDGYYRFLNGNISETREQSMDLLLLGEILMKKNPLSFSYELNLLNQKSNDDEMNKLRIFSENHSQICESLAIKSYKALSSIK